MALTALPTVQRRRLGEPGDGVFRGGVRRGQRPRRVRGDRAIVDDAAALRVLRSHDAKRLPSAEEHPGEVYVHHVLPFGEREFVDQPGRGAHTGVVEQQIHPAVVGNGGVEQLTHGGLVRYIRYNRIERTGASPDRTEQRLDVSPGEHDGPTVARQRQRDSRADAAAGAGNHGDSRRL
jgi:hypothetical protein